MNNIQVVRREQDADLGYMLTDVGRVAVIIYDDGTVLTPTDWQAPQPSVLDDDDIAQVRWVDDYGRLAIIIDGQPRILC